jgi:hypothetical protein
MLSYLASKDGLNTELKNDTYIDENHSQHHITISVARISRWRLPSHPGYINILYQTVFQINVDVRIRNWK